MNYTAISYFIGIRIRNINQSLIFITARIVVVFNSVQQNLHMLTTIHIVWNKTSMDVEMS